MICWVSWNALTIEEWNPDANAIIGMRDMYSCVSECVDSDQRPDCIQWKEI